MADGGLVQIHAKGPRRARLSTCSRYPGKAARQVPRRAPGLATAIDLRRLRAWLKTMGAQPVAGYSGRSRLAVLGAFCTGYGQVLKMALHTAPAAWLLTMLDTAKCVPVT